MTNSHTKATKNTATFIDHIFTNIVLDDNLKTGMINTDISHHFSIVFILKGNENKNDSLK